jgi:hypothetical protein
MDFCFHLDFDPASPTVQETSKSSVDKAFMVKTQNTLLYSFRTHVRGVHTLEISGVSTELSESVKREVAQTPFDDLDACFGRLEQKCQLGRELMEQKKTIEASVVWTNIWENCLGSMRKSTDPKETGATKSYTPVRWEKPDASYITWSTHPRITQTSGLKQ